MKRALACAALLAGLTATAYAADLSLDSVKDAASVIPDGPITWGGVTFYGTVDVGYAYVNNGSYPSGAGQWGAGYSVLGSAYNHGSVSTITNNALQLSNVGLKFDYGLGYDFRAIGKLETQFNPISGELSDGCASMLRFSGKSLYDQDKNGDSTRCGQAFSNAAFGGLSHPLYGTLTVGRQGNLVNDGMGQYDPIAGSPAFSMLGYSSTVGAGYGSTETSAWDNSVKYIFTYGPFHAAGMYSNGGQDTSIVDDGYGANAGITYKGFSIDGFYQKVDGAVALKGLPLATTASGLGYFGSTSVINSCTAAFGNCPNYLLGTVTNNEGWDIMAKYAFDVPSLFGQPAVSTKDSPCGGLKDEPCAPPLAKVTIYGGYQGFTQSNPDHNQSYYSGFTTNGGYRYITSPTGTITFGSDRDRQTAWAGVSYQDGPWRLAGAWYYTDSASYLDSSKRTCLQATAANVAAQKKGTFVGNPVGGNCSGDFNQGSFLIDYTVTKHFDVYAGVSVSDQTGGLNSGFLEDNSFVFASGVRVKW